MKNRSIVPLMSLLMILFVSINAQCEDKFNLPDYMNKLVFESKRFATPIEFCIPHEDDKSLLYEIRNTKYGLEPIFYMKGYKSIDKSVLKYMMKNGFAYVDWAKVKAGYGIGNKHYFLFYTDKFKSLSRLQSVKEKYCFNIGTRVVKSIDFRNKYKGSPNGIEMQFHSITFSYIIEGNLPELPAIKKVYNGAAKAYQDPDDGEWKLAKFKLEDGGKYEYLKQIRDAYPKYLPWQEVKNRVENSIKSGNYIKGEVTYRHYTQSYVWPIEIKITSFNSQSGDFVGQIEWTTGSAIHRIDGNLSDFHLSFKETAFIKKGKAALGCEYKINEFEDKNKIKGIWGGCDNTSGSVYLYLDQK